MRERRLQVEKREEVRQRSLEHQRRQRALESATVRREKEVKIKLAYEQSENALLVQKSIFLQKEQKSAEKRQHFERRRQQERAETRKKS